MKAMILALSLFFVVSAHAGLVTQSADTVVYNNQTVPASGVTTVNGQDVSLTTVMAAMRSKVTALVIKTDVYVLQFLVNSPETFNKSQQGNEALESLAATQDVVAVQLIFKYPVDASTLFNAFVTALKVNAVDLKSTEIRDFLKNVKSGGDVLVDQTLTFLIVKSTDGTEIVSYENNAGVVTSVTGNAGFGKSILSMWLGNIDSQDSGLEKTKQDLLK